MPPDAPDARTARANLAELLPVELCGSEPLSNRDLIDELGGNQMSGHHRVVIQRELDAALMSFYEAAREVAGTDEGAAIILLRMVARDQSYEPPPWMKELFAAHREALGETFHQPERGRQTDYGAPDVETDKQGRGVVQSGTRAGARMAIEKVAGAATLTAAEATRPAKLSGDALATVAALFVDGRVSEAARLAGVTSQDLHHWRAWSGPFRAACRGARAVQHSGLAAE